MSSSLLTSKKAATSALSLGRKELLQALSQVVKDFSADIYPSLQPRLTATLPVFSVEIIQQNFELIGRDPRSYAIHSEVAIDVVLTEIASIRRELEDILEPLVLALEHSRFGNKMIEDMAVQTIESRIDDSGEQQLGLARIVCVTRQRLDIPVLATVTPTFKGIHDQFSSWA